ncbi:MAG: helix-turn-helix domain-containing protein [Chloroflexota bacterium]
MSETMTMREAARHLGVSHTKIWRLVKNGALHAQTNPLDGRERLIQTAELEELKERDRDLPYFVSDAVVNVAIAPPASEIEQYLRTQWRG